MILYNTNDSNDDNDKKTVSDENDNNDDENDDANSNDNNDEDNDNDKDNKKDKDNIIVVIHHKPQAAPPPCRSVAQQRSCGALWRGDRLAAGGATALMAKSTYKLCCVAVRLGLSTRANARESHVECQKSRVKTPEEPRQNAINVASKRQKSHDKRQT